MQVQKQIDELLAKRASQWYETLGDGDEKDYAAFKAWLRESKLHVQAYLEIVAVETELAGFDRDRKHDVDAILKSIPTGVIQLSSRGSALLPPRSAMRYLRWPLALAATAALFAVALIVAMGTGQAEHAFATSVGEQRAVTLADTSIVHLNADSEIEVDIGDTTRTVELLRGEAMFKVAHDEQRPFRVRTRGGTVQAVGTQFNVYDQADGSGTRVSVLEGKVRITPEGSGEDQSQLLGAGEEALLRRNGSIERAQKPNIASSVAWRQRRLVFDQTPLEEMVREFNRYSTSKVIRLEGIEPRAHHYDGIFDADDPESLAALLMRDEELLVEIIPASEDSREEIVIRPRPP
jgi:transmembrane sensor